MRCHMFAVVVRIAALAAISTVFCVEASAAVIRLELRDYFTWGATPAHTGYFDGRLLTANDLKQDQSYSRSADRYLGTLPDSLEAVFGAAGKSDVVLLFDEADALFGKRTNVMDANDKYADDFVLLDLGRGTWSGRLYFEGTDDTEEGVYDDLSGTFEMLTTVSEPATVMLTGLGLAGLGAAAARRKSFKRPTV